MSVLFFEVGAFAVFVEQLKDCAFTGSQGLLGDLATVFLEWPGRSVVKFELLGAVELGLTLLEEVPEVHSWERFFLL